MKTQYMFIWLDVLYSDDSQDYIQYGKHFRGNQWYAYYRILKQAIRSLPDDASYSINSVSFS